MTQFHTVKEAAQIVGKSPSAIRRIIHPIARDDAHPDRGQIRPTPDEVRKLREKGANFPWRISDDLLRQKIPNEPRTEKGTGGGGETDSSHGNRDLLLLLRGELEIKNQQIATLSQSLSKQIELISEFTERIREGNVLIGTLQKQLSLIGAGDRNNPGVIDATTSQPATPAPSTKGDSPTRDLKKSRDKASPPPKAAPAAVSAKPAKPKRGFFSRLFG